MMGCRTLGTVLCCSRRVQLSGRALAAGSGVGVRAHDDHGALEQSTGREWSSRPWPGPRKKLMGRGEDRPDDAAVAL